MTGQHCGERIRIMAGLGMTETSPCCLFTTRPIMRSGYVGTPAPGCELKLVPVGDKLEARFRGPHVMRGYWRLSEEPAAPVFDEDGYYCSGDALRFYDADHPKKGLVFDGRIAEDFKLSSGTFVSVGPLRARVIAAGAPYVQDVVIAGMNRDDIGLLVFPQVERCRRLSGLPPSASAAEVLAAPAVRAAFAALLHELNATATGSARAWRAAVARCAAIARPRRDHRQGHAQPARRAGPPCRAGRHAVSRWRSRRDSRGLISTQHDTQPAKTGFIHPGGDS
ncbi:hypothetical protein GCM10023063_49540 [Arthrobacter methylotrophus]|uniref:AMP-binding protein n=1 Tax=Arthrobacter methylotrophus TaxID=121291 RepID=UPI0031E930BD